MADEHQLEIATEFEPNRLQDKYFADAYRHLVPIMTGSHDKQNKSPKGKTKRSSGKEAVA